MFLPRSILEEKLRDMLKEDVGQGDITTALLISADTHAQAAVVSREAGTVAGIEEAQTLLESLGLGVKALVADGKRIHAKQVLLRISGNARTILSVERTLLNILCRMSGIATTTRNLVEKLRDAKFETKIACTRKSAPGLLYLDKKAVSVGGGDTHRLHLDDMILIKDNHVAVVGSVSRAVSMAKERASLSKKIEVEVARVADVLEAVDAGADIVMLDNFSPSQIKEAVGLLRKKKKYGRVLLEASGGISSENVLKFASTGVDLVSLGEITHSARALNLSLEIVKTKIRSKSAEEC